MQLNQAQRLFKAFRATGLCPYVAEQAVRNVEARIAQQPEYGDAGPRMEGRINLPNLMTAFAWRGTPQGHDFWAGQRAAQHEANYL